MRTAVTVKAFQLSTSAAYVNVCVCVHMVHCAYGCVYLCGRCACVGVTNANVLLDSTFVCSLDLCSFILRSFFDFQF